MKRHVLQLQVLNVPEGFVGIVNGYVFKLHVLHLAEKFGAVNHAVAHRHVVRIPDGRARLGSKVAVGYHAAIDVPPRIFAEESTAVGFEVGTLLNGRLAVAYGDVLHAQVVRLEQRTLAAKYHILYSLHAFTEISYCFCKITKNNSITMCLYFG